MTTRLHLSARRVTALLLVVVVLAAAGAALALTQPRRYTARITVFVARVMPLTGGADVNTVMADFQTALQLPQVDDAVSVATGAAPGAVAKGVTLNRIANSSSTGVSFEGSSPSEASAVVTSASQQALLLLAKQLVDSATDAQRAAQDASSSAAGALDAFNQSLGVDDVASEFQRHSQNLITLQDQQAVTPSASLAALIATEQAEVNKLAAGMPRYNQLNGDAASAAATLATANQALTSAQASVNAANSSTVLTPSVVATASRAATVVRLAGIAALIGAALTIVMFMLADRQGATPEPGGTDLVGLEGDGESETSEVEPGQDGEAHDVEVGSVAAGSTREVGEVGEVDEVDGAEEAGAARPAAKPRR